MMIHFRAASADEWAIDHALSGIPGDFLQVIQACTAKRPSPIRSEGVQGPVVLPGVLHVPLPGLPIIQGSPLGLYGGLKSESIGALKSYADPRAKTTPACVVFNPFLEESLARSGLRKIGERQTNVLEIRGRNPEQMLRDVFNRNTRGAIRRGERSEYTVKTGNDSVILDHFFDLYALSSMRWGKRRPSPGREFFKALRGVSWIRIFLAYHGEKPAFGVIIASLGNQDYYWFGSMDRNETAWYTGTHLMAQAIFAAALRGAEYFNFGPSVGIPGVQKFKESFGGTKLSYGIYFQGNAGVAAALRVIYGPYHRLRMAV